MLSFVHGSCVTLKHCAPVQKKHAGSESRCRHVTAQLFLEPLEFPKYILKNRHWRNYTQGHFYNKTIACCWDMKRVTLHYIFSTLTKYTLDMRWFMMLGEQVSSCLIWVETANLARRHKPPSALIGALKEVLGGNEDATASYSWLPSLDSGLS